MSQPQWLWSETLKQHYYITEDNGRTMYVCRDGTRHTAADQRNPRSTPGGSNSNNARASYQYDDQYTTAGDVAQLSNWTERMTIADGSRGNPQREYPDPPERRDANGVASRIKIGPNGEKVLLGSSGDQEILDPAYRKRSKPRDFFKVGKVFLTLWSEPTNRQDTEDTLVTRVRFREHVYTQIRRFVVIRENQRHCTAVPILTYGGRALTKGDVDPSEHALIYTGAHPGLNDGDHGIVQMPLLVDPSEAGERLDPLSRVNLAKWYTIEHNLKVKPFGMVRNVPALLEAVYQATGSRISQMREAVQSPNVAIQPARSGTGGNSRQTTDQQPRSSNMGQQALAGSSRQALQSNATDILQSQLQMGQITTAQYQYGMQQLAARARAIQARRAQQAADEDESTDEEEEDQ